MGLLTYKVHVSIDGFIGREDGSLDWIDPGFEDPELEKWEVDLLWKTDVHFMGRRLFENMAAYWPTSDEAIAAPMNAIPKAVLSNTLRSAPWAEDNIVGGDLTGSITEMKASSPQGVLLHGGSRTAIALDQLGLINRWVLARHPVVLGRGLPIFASEQRLQAVETRTFEKCGVVATVYDKAP